MSPPRSKHIHPASAGASWSIRPPDVESAPIPITSGHRRDVPPPDVPVDEDVVA